MPKHRKKRHSVTQPSDQSYRLIPLTQRQNAVVDAADFKWLSQWNWHAAWSPLTKSFYARRWHHGAKMLFMAREIMQCGDNEEVDHKNHDTLDNRRTNLRICLKKQNSKNRRCVIRRARNGYFKGVYLRNKKWHAQIRHDSILYHLGIFNDPKEAASAYDEAAIRFHGEFALLNFRT